MLPDATECLLMIIIITIIMMINIISNLQKVKNLISQYLYRNVQFSRASLNEVLFLSQYFEETGVPGGNPPSQVEID